MRGQPADAEAEAAERAGGLDGVDRAEGDARLREDGGEGGAAPAKKDIEVRARHHEGADRLERARAEPERGLLAKSASSPNLEGRTQRNTSTWVACG